jgi:hypothetical protein
MGVCGLCIPTLNVTLDLVIDFIYVLNVNCHSFQLNLKETHTQN